MGKLIALFPNKKYREALKYVHSYVRTYVDKALALQASSPSSQAPKETNPERYIFLEELAKTGYSAQKIEAELLNILLAGRDTTASLLTILFMVLSQNQDVFEKLRKEVMALEGRRPSFEEIKDMKYLKWCINECQFHPSSFPNCAIAKSEKILTTSSIASLPHRPNHQPCCFSRHGATTWRWT